MGYPLTISNEYKYFSTINLAINSFTSQDSLFHDLLQVFEEKVLKFLTLESYQVNILPQPSSTKLELRITLSANMYIHERKSGTFLAWLSDVGGLNDAFKLIIAPLVAVISSTEFSLAVTNEMPTDFRGEPVS